MEQINFQTFNENLYRSLGKLISFNTISISNIVAATCGIACAIFLSQQETFNTSSFVIKYTGMAIMIIAPITLCLKDFLNYQEGFRELPRRTPPLHSAIDNHDSKAVKLLLETGCDIEEVNHVGQTPLHRVFFDLYVMDRKIDIDLVKLLLDNGTNVDCVDTSGRTPLSIAIKQTNDIDLIELLLIRGANIEAMDHERYNPIKYALHKGNIEIIRLLLAYATLTEIPRFSSRFRQTEAIELLLEAGANPFMFSTEDYPEIKDKIEMYQQRNNLKNPLTNI